MALSDQMVLPGGATGTRITDVLDRPAMVALEAGDAPPETIEDNSPPPEVLGVRALEPAEARLLVAAEDGRRHAPKVPLDAADKMRVRHHAIARLLAAGRKPAEIARIMDVTPTSISMLERSPAFQALLLEYMNAMDKEAIDSYTRLKVLNHLGIDELTDRLLNKAEEFKPAELLKLVEVTSDRTGLGPTSKQVTLNGQLTPADIRALKSQPQPVVIEASTIEDRDGEAGGYASVCGGEEGAEPPPKGRSELREESAQAAAARAAGSDDLISDLVGVLGLER